MGTPHFDTTQYNTKFVKHHVAVASEITTISLFSSWSIHTHTHTHNRLTAFCPGLPGHARTRRNIHPLTPILIIGHPLSSSSIYNNPWQPLCSVYELDSPLVQPLQVLFGLPLGLGPSTSYSMHFFTQSSSSFRSTCPYQRSWSIIITKW